jgi:hypothetical protein
MEKYGAAPKLSRDRYKEVIAKRTFLAMHAKKKSAEF